MKENNLMVKIDKAAAKKYLSSIGCCSSRVEDEKSRREHALDVMLGVLKEENGRSHIGVVAEDADYSHLNLDKHDKRFHGGRFDEKTMTCKLRDDLAKADNPDAALVEHETKIAGLSGKKVEEYARLLGKRRKDLDPEETLLKIASIKDVKLQGDSFRWLLKGAIRLPEDLSKVREAREYAARAKKDPFSYETPQACVNDLAAFKPKEKAIDPDTVPELSDKKVLPMGVTTYLVQDDQKGQAAMRRIIDTHWGKDANPWCLLARENDEDREDSDADDRFIEWWNNLSASDRNKYGKTDLFTDENVWDEGMGPYDGGEPERAAVRAQDYYFRNVDHCYDANDASMRNAWNYWNHYNALPKRVAFKDGKLLAFMATDTIPSESTSVEEDEHEERLINENPELYKEYEYKYDHYELPMFPSFFKWLEENHIEKIEGLGEQWWDRNDDDHEGIPVGNLPVKDDPYGRWADYEIRDGKAHQVGAFKKGQSGHDGYVEWNPNGSLKEVIRDGRSYNWRPDGSFGTVQELNGDWFGAPRYNFNPDGSFSGMFKDMARQEDPNAETIEKIKKDVQSLVEKYTPKSVKGNGKMNLREVADAAIRESELVATEDAAKQLDKLKQLCRMGKISKAEFKTGLAGLYAAGLITMNQFDVAKRQFK